MQFEVGMIVEGKVKSITNFGAFLELEGGKTGMVHISEISTNFVKSIRDYLEEGQVIKTKIINISEKGEIGLSIRKLNDNPTNKPRNEFTKVQKTRPGNFEWQKSRKETPKTSFEDMLSVFKSASEEKMSDLKRVTESKRGGYSRKRNSK